jgi:hypothetical protein
MSLSAIFDNVGPAYYSQIQGLYPYMPFGLRNYWTGRFVDELPDDLIDFLVEHQSYGNLSLETPASRGREQKR